MRKPNFMQQLAINILDQAGKMFDDNKGESKPLRIEIDGDTFRAYDLRGRLVLECIDSENYRKGYRWAVIKNDGKCLNYGMAKDIEE